VTHSIATVIKLVLIAFALAANAFYLLSIVAGYRFFRRGAGGGESDGADPFTPPVSIMVPLRGADHDAYGNYVKLCCQDYPAYQLVFGVQDGADSSIPIVRRLMSDFPGVDIDLVICAESHGQNAKVSNLLNMLSRVKHEHVVILDSDIRVSPHYLRAVIRPLSEPGVGLVTCLYRGVETSTFGARLEATGFTGEFAAGVLVAWMMEGVRFALGSTMATTRARLEEIGGLSALADYLADDFMLGSLMARGGYEVRLSHHIVEITMPPMSFATMVRHQLRWARSTRISRPLGYLGLILTYGTALAALNVVVDRASVSSLGLLGATLAVRLTMAWLIGVNYLKDRLLRSDLWLVPIRDLLSFLIWAVSWVGRRVEWRGRLFEVARDGKMVLSE
jgi:ceramide glucosyltransferase